MVRCRGRHAERARARRDVVAAVGCVRNSCGSSQGVHEIAASEDALRPGATDQGGVMKRPKHMTVRRKEQRLAESMYYRHLRQCARTLIVATLTEQDGNRTLTAL